MFKSNRNPQFRSKFSEDIFNYASQEELKAQAELDEQIELEEQENTNDK